MSNITDRVDINRFLAQMQDMKTQAQSQPQPQGIPINAGVVDGPVHKPGYVGELGNVDKVNFTDLLKKAVDSVNETQMKAGELTKAYELGDESVDITQVMIQLQKASVSFEAMTQVRNRLVSAYQDIMNMPF